MPVSPAKRQRERSRQEKQKEKELRRQARRNERPTRADVPAGEDPDLVGIVPGPQPPQEEP